MYDPSHSWCVGLAWVGGNFLFSSRPVWVGGLGFSLPDDDASSEFLACCSRFLLSLLPIAKRLARAYHEPLSCAGRAWCCYVR